MALRMKDETTKPWPLWLLISCACFVPAVLNALGSYVNSRFGPRGAVDWPTVIFAASLWIFFGILSPFIYVLARRYPLRRENLRGTIAIHLFGALVLCVTWVSLGVALSAIMNRRPPQETFLRYYSSYILVSLPWSLFLYFTVLGCVLAFTYYREARERESQQARLAAQLAEARLGALRMQLHPHFLFNSLNAITVLVRDENTSAASKTLELLSGVLRQVLQSEKRQQVTLAEEIQFIEKYLAIEQVRFSDRLKVRWSVDPSLCDALVPEFILQPLVENAVRHGVAKRGDAGVIEVTASSEGGALELSVKDDGPGYRRSSEAGVGISNTRARLKTLFGESGNLELLGGAAGGTIATVRFPLLRQVDG
jgi:two-component system, LytTR family, sensor kinase